MEVKVLKREQSKLPTSAVKILQDILKIKSPTIRRLKATIRQALDMVDGSGDS